MLDWLSVLLFLWLISGLLYFVVVIISALFSRRKAAGPNPLALLLHFVWMLPILSAIYLVAGIWWVWDKLFKSEDK